jgi:hypothetical protein
MNTPLLRWMLLTALFMATVFPETSRAATAPLTLVGRRFSLTDTNGTNTIMRFLANNRYERSPNENGYFTATRSAADKWNVATTKSDGSETIQYTFVYTSSESGTYTELKAGSRVTGSFNEASIPTAGLAMMIIQNEVSQTGPSTYTNFFSGGTVGTFEIKTPGYGFGEYTYTPGTNSAKLELIFGGDLAGDIDDLDLEFNASSGSLTPSRHSGAQFISGKSYPVSGTFTYTSIAQ